MTSLADPPAPILPSRLFEDYSPSARVHDEMVSASGTLHPHVELFVRSLERLSHQELTARWESAKRAIRDNAVSYNVYGDGHGVDRPWTLDMIPLLVAQGEWVRLETALSQRSRLLNLILTDIYGPQRLLHDGLIPPFLVLGNPAFLRPCHGIAVPYGIHLHLHAADIGRAPDGQWWVLGDRTQTPSGAGYALENRIVLSRSLPEVFRDCRVQRLASFFRAQLDTLTAMCPISRDDPRVVLLTPGPHSETYFEHAYLARYLGLTLVESGDLTVRDRHVYLKTLEGLQPVDVIFRRLDDVFCDPLEIGADSTLGISGLVEATRAGNVAIANALGSGVVETPALAAFLPDLCRHLLGEELLLPSAASWWCGEPDGLQHVLDRMERLVIRRTFPGDLRQPVFPRTLSEGERRRLVDKIRTHPAEYVGQEEIALSAAPTWVGSQLEPRPVVLRIYVAATGQSHVAMPGGLTRTASTTDVPIVSIQRGGGSKDTWVLSDGPVSTVSLLTSTGMTIRREPRGTDLPSRVADNLFWLGRHAERAEHKVRVLRSLVACLTDEATTEDTPELLALLQVLVELDVLPPHLQERMPLRALERELAYLFKQNPYAGMRQALHELRLTATAVRDRLSLDTWRILNQLQRDFRARHGRLQFADALVHLNRMITDLAAFSGMEMENMTRGHGWRFLDVGRRLERSLDLTGLVASVLRVTPSPGAALDPMLDIADSAMTYRRRYFAQPELAPVLDLVLADATNARALAFQLAALGDHMVHLPHNAGAQSPAKHELIAHAEHVLRDADLTVLSQSSAEGQYPGLTGLLGAIEADLRALSDAITHDYFSHATLSVS